MDQSAQHITGEDPEGSGRNGVRSKRRTYEEKLKELGLTTLEERRHQADIVQVYKIRTGKDRVQRECWFKMAEGGTVRTRQATGLMNIVKPKTRGALKFSPPTFIPSDNLTTCLVLVTVGL